MAKYLNSKKVMVDNNDKKAQGAVREERVCEHLIDGEGLWKAG